jgi:hypothetical protein
VAAPATVATQGMAATQATVDSSQAIVSLTEAPAILATVLLIEATDGSFLHVRDLEGLEGLVGAQQWIELLRLTVFQLAEVVKRMFSFLTQFLLSQTQRLWIHTRFSMYSLSPSSLQLVEPDPLMQLRFCSGMGARTL